MGRFRDAWDALKARFVDPQPVLLVICRKYLDANGRYIGELYAQHAAKHGGIGSVNGLTMIGVSLDSLALGATEGQPDYLDTHNDFLALMPDNVIRVGAMEPLNTLAVRLAVRKMPKKCMRILLQNRFIESVVEGKAKC